MTTFFTADNHWHHVNVIKFCGRPFRDVTDMDEAMIRNWNQVVGVADVVYHLGDFTLAGPEAATKLIRRLNGCIIFLDGRHHHDRHWQKSMVTLVPGQLAVRSASGHPAQVVSSLCTLKFGDVAVALCHYPVEEWDRKHYDSIHLHGHSHGKSRIVPNRYDVGVDVNDFTPVTLEQIIRKAER